jgi:hypothetical protein
MPRRTTHEQPPQADPRIVGMVGRGNPGLLFIALALAEALGPEKTQAVLSKISQRGPDLSVPVAGQPLRVYVGLSRAQLTALYGERAAGEIADALGEQGMEPDDDSQPSAPAGPTIPAEPRETPMSTASPGPIPPAGQHVLPDSGEDGPPAAMPPVQPPDRTAPFPGAEMARPDAPPARRGRPPNVARPTPEGRPTAEAPADPHAAAGQGDEATFAGYSWNELAGKNADQLRAMDNIGEATLARIREHAQSIGDHQTGEEAGGHQRGHSGHSR